MLCDVDNISGEYKRTAVDIEYLKSGELKPRVINSMSRFWKVISTKQLRRWEKQINIDDSKKKKLRQISAYTLDKFTEAVRKGYPWYRYYTMSFASARKLIGFQSITWMG